MRSLAALFGVAVVVACSTGDFAGTSSSKGTTKPAVTKPDVSVPVGQKKSIESLVPAGSKIEGCTVADPKVASCDPKTGEITGIAPGSTTVTVKTGNGGEKVISVGVIAGGSDNDDGTGTANATGGTANATGGTAASTGSATASSTGATSASTGESTQQGTGPGEAATSTGGTTATGTTGTGTTTGDIIIDDNAVTADTTEPMQLDQLKDGATAADVNMTVVVTKTDANGAPIAATGIPGFTNPFSYDFKEGEAGSVSIPGFCQKKGTPYFRVVFKNKDGHDEATPATKDNDGVTPLVLQTGGGDNAPEVTADPGSCITILGKCVDRDTDNTFAVKCPGSKVLIEDLTHQ
jgi:hypothetical protein